MKKILLAITALCAVFVMDAKVVLPNVIGDNMVLQRDSEVKLWGTAEPGKKVTISTSWSKEKTVVKAGDDGKWTVSVKTAGAGGPFEITFNDGDILTLKNILLGEVWFCSGQSNMEMPIKGFNNQSVEGVADVIIGARPETPIRMCTVRRTASCTPQENCDARWLEHTPENVAGTSATAYFFAEYLQKTLNVPVGIIISAYGGTPIEAWMDKKTISEKFPEFNLAFLDADQKPKNLQHQPTTLYNSMVAPVIPYTVKGIIWYQGESNRKREKQYERLQPEFVGMLREQWGIGEIPFYYVQIAPYNYDNPMDNDGAKIREAQMKNLAAIPSSGMAVTLDIGDPDCIHPAKKKEVGHRLAYMALEKNYGFTMIDSYAPVYQSMEVRNGTAYLSFKAGRLGIGTRGRPLAGFEVAGADRIFHPAKAVIRGGNTVEVRCDQVPEPVAVRYAFHNYAEASFINNFGIPASSFRTDDWE